MSTAKLPRVILVTRPTDYQNLLVHQGSGSRRRRFVTAASTLP